MPVARAVAPPTNVLARGVSAHLGLSLRLTRLIADAARKAQHEAWNPSTLRSLCSADGGKESMHSNSSKMAYWRMSSKDAFGSSTMRSYLRFSGSSQTDFTLQA